MRDFSKVLDFGIAKGRDLADVTGAAHVVGSLTTMSPEAAAGRLAVPASDVYSLGVTAFHALTGAYPFTGNTVGVLFAHIQKEAPDVSALRPDVPPELAAIVRRCLEKDPAHRYPSARELEVALAAAAARAPWSPPRAGARAPAGRDADATARTLAAGAIVASGAITVERLDPGARSDRAASDDG